MSPALQDLLRLLAARLYDWYAATRSDDWRWFEGVLTYDNARLPQALIAAGYRLGEPEWQRAGLEALDWYAAQCGIETDNVRLVGNHWRLRLHPVPVTDDGDEQPLDAAALVEALVEALVSTGDHQYGAQAVRAFEWFLGRNRLRAGGLRLRHRVAATTGSGRTGVNENEGAESTLAFLQALLALDGAGLQFSVSIP